MEAITYTAARQNLAKTMKKVCRDHAPAIGPGESMTNIDLFKRSPMMQF